MLIQELGSQLSGKVSGGGEGGEDVEDGQLPPTKIQKLDGKTSCSRSVFTEGV